MGLFDTIEFPLPIKCKVCGKEHTSTQTKMFENLMVNYGVGDILPRNFITGVFQETIYCDHDDDEKENSWDQEIFLAVWHNILIDIEEDYKEAERKVRKFSQGDLYLLYQNLYQERNKYRYKYDAVVDWTEKYIKYQNLTNEGKEKLLKEEDSLANFYMKTFAEKMVESKSPFKDYLDDIDSRKNYDLLMLF